jgi:hypothetical protein
MPSSAQQTTPSEDAPPTLQNRNLRRVRDHCHVETKTRERTDVWPSQGDGHVAAGTERRGFASLASNVRVERSAASLPLIEGTLF